MALIKCKECDKEVSDNAQSCAHCGYHMSSDHGEKLMFPDLPDDLNIGKQVTNWSGDAAIKGFCEPSENVVEELPSGEATVAMHTHGISLLKGVKSYNIHNSQIISLKSMSRTELSQVNKSVIGRAVVGGVILGPLGAIVGGMSGTGTKEKTRDRHYLIINFWDINTKAAQTILVSGNLNIIESFITRHEREKEKNETGDRVAEKDSPPYLIYGIIIVAVLTVMYLMW